MGINYLLDLGQIPFTHQSWGTICITTSLHPRGSLGCSCSLYKHFGLQRQEKQLSKCNVSTQTEAQHRFSVLANPGLLQTALPWKTSFLDRNGTFEPQACPSFSCPRKPNTYIKKKKRGQKKQNYPQPSPALSTAKTKNPDWPATRSTPCATSWPPHTEMAKTRAHQGLLAPPAGPSLPPPSPQLPPLAWALPAQLVPSLVTKAVLGEKAFCSYGNFSKAPVSNVTPDYRWSGFPAREQLKPIMFWLGFTPVLPEFPSKQWSCWEFEVKRPKPWQGTSAEWLSDF